MKYSIIKNSALLFIFFLHTNYMAAQQYDCYFKPPILKIDFGNSTSTSAVDVGNLDNYNEDGGTCPQDGNFSIISYTSDCYRGNWLNLFEDHTPGDAGGNMMVVNAAMDPGIFFNYPIHNVTANTTYEISMWIINICVGDNGCTPTPPILNFNLFTSTGVPIIVISTGDINPVAGGRWLRYYARFTTPANTTGLILKMNDAQYGGCGNDFALDDIELRECIMQKPNTPVTVAAKPVNKETKPVLKETTPAPKPAVKQLTPPATATFKKTSAIISNETVKQKPVETKTFIKEMPVNIPVPQVLLSRNNSLVKTIEIPEGEMLIELYDNGEIDGDTVTVYHNNSLLVANAALSAKPVRIKIKIDKQHPHHDLVMVANNLGSIPPNTSLMIITAKDQRYEIFISSSEQKNARAMIKLKE